MVLGKSQCVFLLSLSGGAACSNFSRHCRLHRRLPRLCGNYAGLFHLFGCCCWRTRPSVSFQTEGAVCCLILKKERRARPLFARLESVSVLIHLSQSYLSEASAASKRPLLPSLTLKRFTLGHIDFLSAAAGQREKIKLNFIETVQLQHLCFPPCSFQKLSSKVSFTLASISTRTLVHLSHYARLRPFNKDFISPCSF